MIAANVFYQKACNRSRLAAGFFPKSAAPSGAIPLIPAVFDERTESDCFSVDNELFESQPEEVKQTLDDILNWWRNTESIPSA